MGPGEYAANPAKWLGNEKMLRNEQKFGTEQGLGSEKSFATSKLAPVVQLDRTLDSGSKG